MPHSNGNRSKHDITIPQKGFLSRYPLQQINGENRTNTVRFGGYRWNSPCRDALLGVTKLFLPVVEKIRLDFCPRVCVNAFTGGNPVLGTYYLEL